MAHILVFEVPGGNDFTVVEDALGEGHKVTFVTSDRAPFDTLCGNVRTNDPAFLEVIEVNPYSYEALERRLLVAHGAAPFDALICILDIRIIDASRLAESLGLRFLNSACARLARDKFSVRERLLGKGVRQPRFALAASEDDLELAVRHVGYPALVKPSDGYGSQNVRVLRSAPDLDELRRDMEASRLDPFDYGLGVRANNRLSVEQFVSGDLVGCDVFSDGCERLLLGVNAKLMYPPPSFAIRGSCFSSQRHDQTALRAYAFEILDAMDFDFGASHIEMIVTESGPYLVEVNPRLVSAQIPFQMGYAFERSIYVDLINLHLGRPLGAQGERPPRWFSAIRWIVADRPGRLKDIALADRPDPMVRRVALFKAKDDLVRPPMSNGDRIGYVIAVGETEAQAERVAEDYVGACQVLLE